MTASADHDFKSLVKAYDLVPDYRFGGGGSETLQRYLDIMFEGILLDGTRVLDIGAGDGTHSLYMATQGADVLALEPEAAGSEDSGPYQTLKSLCEKHDRLEAEPETLQSFERDEQFDLIYMHDVINHLDEEVCIQLHESQEAQQTYQDIFREMYGLTAEDGTVLIADCDRTHFYDNVGLDNPFTPNIEWHKHQPPQLWSGLLQSVGYRQRDLDWTPIVQFGNLGTKLTGNYVASHLTRSHFRLVMDK